MAFFLSKDSVLDLYFSHTFVVVVVHLYWVFLPSSRLFDSLLTHSVRFFPGNNPNWIGTVIITMLHINKLRKSKLSNFFQITQLADRALRRIWAWEFQLQKPAPLCSAIQLPRYHVRVIFRRKHTENSHLEPIEFLFFIILPSISKSKILNLRRSILSQILFRF